MQLEKLYKKSKTGAVVYTNISVEGDTITVETGQVGTNSPVFHKTACEPKNTGRSNATSSNGQAILEAKAKHAKKVKERYVLNPNGESEIRLPIKVKGYKDQLKNIIFPCFMSPKLDGGNGLALRDDEVTLIQRGGDAYPTLGVMGSIGYYNNMKEFVATGYSMADEISHIMDYLGVDAVNGELYKHGVHLQDIQSAAKKENALTGELEFHVFDYCGTDDKFDKRMERMSKVEDLFFVKMIGSVIANSHEEIELYHTECVVNGYEGIVIRNADGVYEYNVRSCDVFKYKIPKDGEYQVIGYSIDKHGHAVWDCICNITPDELDNRHRELTPAKRKKFIADHTFSVKRKGNAELRLAEAAIADEKIGKWLKIEFESFSKLLKPLKPVGIVFRECDADGKVLE